MFNNINWILPNLFYIDEYTFALHDILRKSEMINPLRYSFGTVKCKWSFNYDSVVKFKDINYINTILTNHYERDITPIINFSNINLTKYDLEDEYCNKILDLCPKYNCEIIVASDILFEYIKNKYPQIRLISSVNKPIFKYNNTDIFSLEAEYYNELSLIYDRVIIRPEFIKHSKLENNLSNKEKFIIIANDACKTNCTLFKTCVEMSEQDFECCKNKSDFVMTDKNLNILSFKDINYLTNQGFSNFLLKDNKQGLFYLYLLYAECLFDNNSDFRKIHNNLKIEIINYIKDGTYINYDQYNFFTFLMAKEIDIKNF